MKSHQVLAALVAAVLLAASPVSVVAAKKDDSKLSAAEYEAKQIAEGKAKGMLSPAPEPPGGSSAAPGPPPGVPGVPIIQPAEPPAPAELSGTALIAAIVIAVAGIALFVDIRHSFS